MRYMVCFEMTGPRDEIVALVPAERARVAELQDAGILEGLYLAGEGGRGWIVMAGDSRAEIDSAVGSLPMAHLMDVEIVQLREG